MEVKHVPKFVLRDDKKFINISGTKIVSIKDQVLISSGVLSLDSLIGGGLQLGSIMLIEEDEFGVFSKYLTKYFLAEGVACKHCLYVSSLDCDAHQMVQELPSSVDYSENAASSAGVKDSEDLKIAWRYQDTPVVHSTPSGSGAPVFGHNFDLTCPYSRDIVDDAEIAYWPPSRSLDENCGDPYRDLLSDLYQRIQRQGHSTQAPQPRRTVLRVVIHRLGSPLWPSADKHLPRFLHTLRNILQSAFATAVVTLPADLLETDLVEQCEHLSDNVIRLQSLANNSNPVYSEYNGLLTVVKLATLNTLASHVPDTRDWAFKLRKRRFVVEKLHLPPELEDSTQREQDIGSVMSCASPRSSVLEF